MDWRHARLVRALGRMGVPLATRPSVNMIAWDDVLRNLTRSDYGTNVAAQVSDFGSSRYAAHRKHERLDKVGDSPSSWPHESRQAACPGKRERVSTRVNLQRERAPTAFAARQ